MTSLTSSTRRRRRESDPGQANAPTGCYVLAFTEPCGEDWRVPFFAVLNAKSTPAQEIDGRFLSDIDERSADAEEPDGLNGALSNEDASSQAYLLAGMETSNSLATPLFE
jgi:hypothetical protein